MINRYGSQSAKARARVRRTQLRGRPLGKMLVRRVFWIVCARNGRVAGASPIGDELYFAGVCSGIGDVSDCLIWSRSAWSEASVASSSAGSMTSANGLLSPLRALTAEA